MPFSAHLLFSWLVIGMLLCGVTSAQSVDVWFGTVTPRGGLSQGIYHARFDSDTGKLSTPTLAAEASSPGFLTRHPKLPILYSVGAVDGEASVVAYAIPR